MRANVVAALNTIKADRKELKKLKDPIKAYPTVIKEVSRILKAMPPTQVLVERLF